MDREELQKVRRMLIAVSVAVLIAKVGLPLTEGNRVSTAITVGLAIVFGGALFYWAIKKQ